MNLSEARQVKIQIGKEAFDLLYPQFAKLLANSVPVKVPVTTVKGNVEVPLTATLISVAEGKQTTTAKLIKEITGWTVKASTEFIKEGEFPKVIGTIVVSKEELQAYADNASADTCLIKVN